ncbi:MAG: isocitrate lyase/PEP mutase family protein [Rhizobiaceae bacterium]
MTIATNSRRQLRSLIEGQECIFPASVHDPISARIAEDIGFEMGMFGGSVASLAVLGAPDLILLTLTELVDQARRMTRASGLPLFVDADHGYGNALNVMRTVEELENAGIAGLSIEDTELPKQFGRTDGKHLLSVAEGVGKIRAAVAARQDKNLVIAARTDATPITGIDDTIMRLKAYERAGADILFAVGAKTMQQVEALAEATKRPLFLGGLPVELMDRQILAEHRVRICLQGHQPFAAAVQAIHDTLKALREGVLPPALDRIADRELMQQLMRNQDHQNNVSDYLD